MTIRAQNIISCSEKFQSRDRADYFRILRPLAHALADAGHNFGDVLGWAMSTTQVGAMTAHLVIPNQTGSDIFLHEACEHLRQTFGIEHSTIQVGHSAEACALA